MNRKFLIAGSQRSRPVWYSETILGWSCTAPLWIGICSGNAATSFCNCWGRHHAQTCISLGKTCYSSDFIESLQIAYSHRIHLQMIICYSPNILSWWSLPHWCAFIWTIIAPTRFTTTTIKIASRSGRKVSFSCCCKDVKTSIPMNRYK